MSKHAVENKLRPPYELYGSAMFILMAAGIYAWPYSFLLFGKMPDIAITILITYAVIRGRQGIKVIFYQKRLTTQKPFAKKVTELPVNTKRLYLGHGFPWQPIHRQRFYQLSLVENQKYITPKRVKDFNLSALPDIGGKPWLHGVGSDNEKPIYLPQANRNSHMVVFGMTRVGKTRLMSNIVAQDIQNSEAVLVLDPKGDLELLQDMREACRAVGREQDLVVLHPGFPQLSAKYNPLMSFTNVSEVATRVAGAIQAEGEGKQFQDFAWKFLNIVATCLHDMEQVITYKSLAFYAMRPKELLHTYCEQKLSLEDPEYQSNIDHILSQNTQKIDRFGKKKAAMTRHEAIQQYVQQYIEGVLQKGDTTIYDAIISDLHYAASLGDEYYSKITASLGPVFDKINKTAAGDVFSWEDDQGLPVITLDKLIREKKVVYLGLDALSNEAMANAVGQAVIADLVSLCGRLYKTDPNQSFPLCLHADEFSNIVRDEFINLLNKAGGAGIKVTAYTQTVNDIGAVFGSNKDKMKMLLGNFGTMVMMRVANQDTAETFIECLEDTQARNSTPFTTTMDKATPESGDYFTTQNTDTVKETTQKLITANDVFSLPKGQAFVLTDGGKLYKIRIPLPKNSPPTSFEKIMQEVNQC